jgi:pimeloyl-ACP methyl ester carboxylesterase
VELHEGSVTANGLRFGTLAAGDLADESAPLALCLHGFPDSAWTFRHLLPELAAAGFRAVAPFMRGYAPTDVPADGRYQTGALVADATALHEALGGSSDAVLVGHDWGAITAYGAGAFAPDRWRRIVTMAVPPPQSAASAFFDYDQFKRSFYVFLFQTPLAELAVGADDLAFIDRLWADWSPSYDGHEDLPRVKAALHDAANVSAAIGYYRALLDGSTHGEELAPQQAAAAQTGPQPTLYLHGSEDGAFGVDSVEGSAAHLAPGSRAEVIDGTGHFLHLERPALVNKLVVEWVTG